MKSWIVLPGRFWSSPRTRRIWRFSQAGVAAPVCAAGTDLPAAAGVVDLPAAAAPVVPALLGVASFWAVMLRSQAVALATTMLAAPRASRARTTICDLLIAGVSVLLGLLQRPVNK